MPLKFNTTDEARKLVLDESKKWRAALEKSKAAKDGAKEIATTMVAATDVLVSTQTFTLDALSGIQAEVEVVKGGVDKTAEAVNMLSEEHDQIKEAVNQHEKKQDMVSKNTANATVKAKATQNALYRLQLERSQSVVVIRNIPPLTANRETYDDLERCVAKLLKELHINRDGIRVNSVRRLQRSKLDRSGDHPALRIELGGVGDKIKIYQAIDHMIKTGKRVTAQVNNEIPEYALKAYKTQCRIATHIRRRDTNLKTRVSIERGDLWPSILTKKRGTGKYEPVEEEIYERAKDDVTRERKRETEKRKKDREDRLLLREDDDMDVSQPGYYT